MFRDAVTLAGGLLALLLVLRMSKIKSTLAVFSAAFALVGSAAVGARGAGDLSDLQARMDEVQAELDATTARLEDLRTQRDVVRERISALELQIDRLDDRKDRLSEQAERRADFLYRQGSVGMFEALVTAEDFGELLDRVELTSQVAAQSNDVFYRLARDEEEVTALREELEERQRELGETTSDLEATAAELQDKFEEAADEYRELKEQLAAERREAAQAAAAPDPAAPDAAPDPAPVPAAEGGGGGGMACPVNGPVSFIDSWGAPRDGHTHVGVDMMADYGTPLVAIVSGTVSSGWSDSGGNMIFLSGEDGNSYWYLHNEQNLVTGGHVSVGQQIATVGDTGNAVGIPHLHFEYHPGGGGPVNPYPLVAGIC